MDETCSVCAVIKMLTNNGRYHFEIYDRINKLMDESFCTGNDHLLKKSNYANLLPRCCKKCKAYMTKYNVINVCKYCICYTPAPEETTQSDQGESDTNEQCMMCEKFYSQADLTNINN